jgi:transcriptional regulator with XRE-family HTH domain
MSDDNLTQVSAQREATPEDEKRRLYKRDYMREYMRRRHAAASPAERERLRAHRREYMRRRYADPFKGAHDRAKRQERMRDRRREYERARNERGAADKRVALGETLPALTERGDGLSLTMPDLQPEDSGPSESSSEDAANAATRRAREKSGTRRKKNRHARTRAVDGVPKTACPWCGSQRSVVYRSKGAVRSDAYRRRRRCAKCGRCWPTLEGLDNVRFLSDLEKVFAPATAARSQETVGERIERLMLKRGWTPPQLAREAHVTTKTLKLINKGQSKARGLTLARIAAALSTARRPVTADELLGRYPRDGRRTSADNPATVGDRIDSLRLECEWTYEQFAAEAHQTVRTVWLIINKKRHPRLRTLEKFAKAFTRELNRPITADELLGKHPGARRLNGHKAS